MTDRIKGFAVVLDRNIRDDDAQPILDAIRQIRHVLSVTPMVSGHEDLFARERVKRELGEKLWKVLRESDDAT